MVGKISGLVFVVTVVLLLSLSQQGFAVGLFGLVRGLAGAGGHGGRLVDVWIGIGAGGEQIRAVIRGRMGFSFGRGCFDAGGFAFEVQLSITEKKVNWPPNLGHS